MLYRVDEKCLVKLWEGVVAKSFAFTFKLPTAVYEQFLNLNCSCFNSQFSCEYTKTVKRENVKLSLSTPLRHIGEVEV
jgi:hypothetical protein